MIIAICDDEKDVRELLKNKIRTICPDAELVLYQTGKELLDARDQIDILFLDIQMPGKDGMETAREFRERSSATVLIFVTALEEYVFEAFDVKAFHYLVKPFSDEKFYTVLQKAVIQYREQNCLSQRECTEEEERSMIIKAGGVSSKVYIKDIIYAEVFNRKVVLHTTKGEIEYYGKLSSLEEHLGQDFFRSHRSYLVHFKYVVKYDAARIILEEGAVLMAKPRYSDFVKQYLRYNQRKREL